MNSVQYREGKIMNRIVTSKDELIKVAKEIVFEEGIENLSIRSLAKRCNIATGSVYNYFSSKAEVVFAVVEEFWMMVFREEIFEREVGILFPEYFQRVYKQLSEHIDEFRSLFMTQFHIMGADDRASRKKKEETCLSHVKKRLLEVLALDSNIAADVWTETFTPDAFVSFIMSNMMMMASNGVTDDSYFNEVIKRLLK